MEKSGDLSQLKGKFLIAMPGMGDPRFEHSVVYMCDHSNAGSMGLIINKPVERGSFDELCSQLSIDNDVGRDVPVLFGGPVETARGFVIHSRDFVSANSTQELGETLSLTSTRDIIEAMAGSKIPLEAGIFMGYAGWSSGQLEEEISANGWLVGELGEGIVLETNNTDKWAKALNEMGIDASFLSGSFGHA
ncbi:MAG: YqgE/AlgH family protein [Paracoccaceae bacterium]